VSVATIEIDPQDRPAPDAVDHARPVVHLVDMVAFEEERG
jgi:hypothetical protein